MAIHTFKAMPQRPLLHAPQPRESGALTVGAILDRLAESSRRPRFSFLLLSLLAEVADERGAAGPFIIEDNHHLPVREYLAARLAGLAKHDRRRQALRERIANEVAAAGGTSSQPDLFTRQARIDEEVEALVRAEAARNVSRCITDLERAGLCSRYYAGRTVDHRNRGGRRHAVYVVSPEVLAALRTRSQMV